MKTVALPIENKVRELDGKLWLALNFVDRGYKAILGPSWEIKNTLDIIEPDVYFAKDNSNGNAGFFNKLGECGVLTCGLSPEGLPPLKWYAKRKADSLKELDIYFAWGERQADTLRTKYGANNIIVTGNPRFDLLMTGLRDFYKSDGEKLKEKYGEYILINTNFGRGNPVDRDQHLKQLNELFPERDNERENKHTARIWYYFKELILYMSEKTNLSIIVRPHPGEDHQNYFDELHHYEGIHVEHSGDVRSWIYGANGVIHYDCTTGIEASLMGTPTVSYQPVERFTDEFSLSQYVSRQASSHKGIIQWIKEYAYSQKNHDINGDKLKKTEEYFENICSLAAPEICEIVNQELKDNNINISIDMNKKAEMFLKCSPLSDKILFFYDKCREYIYNTDASLSRKRRRQKFPNMNRQELKNKIKNLNHISSFDAFNVEKVYRTNHCYSIK